MSEKESSKYGEYSTSGCGAVEEAYGASVTLQKALCAGGTRLAPWLSETALLRTMTTAVSDGSCLVLTLAVLAGWRWCGGGAGVVLLLTSLCRLLTRVNTRMHQL